MDWGVLFGVSGMVVGLVSLIYAKTQALHAQRLADSAQLTTALEIQQAMAERIYRSLMDFGNNPAAANLYLEANPVMQDVYKDVEALKAGSIIRNMINNLQDVYFLRKNAIVGDHHWRSWSSAFLPVSRMPLARSIFENAVSREALEPEFIAFMRDIFAGDPPVDPLHKHSD